MPEIEARWGGYCAQNTQPMFIGKAPAEYKEMFVRQQEAVQICYEMLRPGETLGAIETRVNAMTDDRYDCKVLMHARGLGDDAPMAVYKTRDDVMADWPIEVNCVFIVKPVIYSKDGTKRIYWGDTVVGTSNGAKRLGKRPPSIIEVD